MAGVLEHLAFEVIIVDLGDLFLESFLLSVGSNDSEAIVSLREVSVEFVRLFLHHTAGLSLSIHGVILQSIEQIHVDCNGDEHVGRKVNSESDLQNTVSDGIEDPVDVPEESSIGTANITCEVAE